MPHFQIIYSSNLEHIVDMGEFCECIRACAVEIDAFPMAGVRVRALRADHFAIADGNPKHGFIDISIRLRGGRPAITKQNATKDIFEAAQKYLAPAMTKNSIALSLEMRDINPDLSPKTGTIRDHLETKL